MKVLGIDQSYRSSGIVILENGIMVYCEKFTTNFEDDIYTRADQLASRIKALAEEHKPDITALEGLSYGSVGNVTRDLGGLLFTIIIFLRQINYDPKLIPPPTVKKFATGKGNCKKEAVIDALPSNVRSEFDALGVKKTTGLSDLADAYWIARTAEA